MRDMRSGCCVTQIREMSFLHKLLFFCATIQIRFWLNTQRFFQLRATYFFYWYCNLYSHERAREKCTREMWLMWKDAPTYFRTSDGHSGVLKNFFGFVLLCVCVCARAICCARLQYTRYVFRLRDSAYGVFHIYLIYDTTYRKNCRSRTKFIGSFPRTASREKFCWYRSRARARAKVRIRMAFKFIPRSANG